MDQRPYFICTPHCSLLSLSLSLHLMRWMEGRGDGAMMVRHCYYYYHHYYMG